LDLSVIVKYGAIFFGREREEKDEKVLYLVE